MKTSKWFVVATEGATADGRTIERRWIEEMAANYESERLWRTRQPRTF